MLQEIVFAKSATFGGLGYLAAVDARGASFPIGTLINKFTQMLSLFP